MSEQNVRESYNSILHLHAWHWEIGLQHIKQLNIFVNDVMLLTSIDRYFLVEAVTTSSHSAVGDRAVSDPKHFLGRPSRRPSPAASALPVPRHRPVADCGVVIAVGGRRVVERILAALSIQSVEHVGVVFDDDVERNSVSSSGGRPVGHDVDVTRSTGRVDRVPDQNAAADDLRQAVVDAAFRRSTVS